jgi:hypothetical protein
MNERIRELWGEADKLARPSGQSSVMMEKFAELIICDCVTQIYPDYIKEANVREFKLLDFAIGRVEKHFGVTE